jgi:hypothetical protein
MKACIGRDTFRVEKQFSKVNFQQGRVLLDADLNEQIDILNHYQRTAIRDIVGPKSGAPAETPVAFKLISAGDTSTYFIGPGRYYVDGILVKNEDWTENIRQPYVPTKNDGTSPAVPSIDGVYCAFLDVHEFHRTGDDDPEIVESALRGPDTATRNKIVWQVKLHRIEQVSDQEWEEMREALLSGSRDNFPINCGTISSFWDSLIAPPNGTMQARTKPEVTIDDPCMLSPGGGYRRLENQLYRVEIHTAGNTDGGATFKFQRDNGSIVTKATDITEKTITVADIGKDRLHGFNSQQWVEIIDDRHELLNQPGTLAKINVISDTELAVDGPVKGDALTNENFPQEFNPKVRRWDSPGGEIPITIPPLNDGWIELEDGIEVRFVRADSGVGPAQYKTGDYWECPARTEKRDIEWQKEGGEPKQKLPDGINHHFAPLALIMVVDGNLHVVDDCRSIFPPLTDLSPTTPSPEPQSLTEMSVWLHGNAVWSQEDFPIVKRSFEPIGGGGPTGGGAHFTFNGDYSSSKDDGVYWFHFPFSTSLPPDKPQALLTEIKVLYNDNIPDTVPPKNKILINVFDGPVVKFGFMGDPPSSASIEGNKLFVLKIDPPYKMNFGLGLSVGIASFDEEGQPSFIPQESEIFFISVGAEFKLQS